MTQPSYDRHHILEPKLEWSMRPQARRLRNTRELIPLIPRPVHEEINANCPQVPILGYHALLHVEREFEPVRGDTLGSMEALMETIEKVSRHERAHPLETELAGLAIWAIDLQRPYIREGLGA